MGDLINSFYSAAPSATSTGEEKKSRKHVLEIAWNHVNKHKKRSLREIVSPLKFNSIQVTFLYIKRRRGAATIDNTCQVNHHLSWDALHKIVGLLCNPWAWRVTIMSFRELHIDKHLSHFFSYIYTHFLSFFHVEHHAKSRMNTFFFFFRPILSLTLIPRLHAVNRRAEWLRLVSCINHYRYIPSSRVFSTTTKILYWRKQHRVWNSIASQ